MRRTILAALFVGCVSAPVLTVAAEGDQQASRAERMKHWAADRETMLDAKLAGMNAGLALTADQEKLWTPFQSAVKDADKSRVDTMGQMMRMRAAGRAYVTCRPSRRRGQPPIAGRRQHQEDRRRRQALYASLDELQKRKFGMLGRILMPDGPGSP